MNGIIILNKPSGYTSMDCCAIIRKLCGEKKVGHTGTLDPNATGVLPVCIGKATRLIEYMDLGQKTYMAGFTLGYTTDTEDIWGEVLSADDREISKESLTETMKLFVGDIEQIPPMYSAKKINGQKLYDLARQGEVVERKPNKVSISRLELKTFDGRNGVFVVECSRGTYVRTLIADIGEKLGCGAVMSSLVRTETCGFRLSDSVKLEDLKEKGPEDFILPIEIAVSGLNRRDINDSECRLLINGNPDFRISEDVLTAVFYNNKLLGITKDRKIQKVFNENI